MKHARRLCCRVTATILIGLVSPVLLAQGGIIIEPPIAPRPRPWPGQTTLVLKSLRVSAEINDGVAVTIVEQRFQNPLPHQVEGTYIFPLPDDVAVGDFATTVGGKILHGEVLDAETARRTYEEIVRRVRDPGLLEFLGARLFRARLFPIPPGGVVDVRLSYSQTLTEQAGLGLFRHPLGADPAATQDVEQVAVQVKLHSSVPLTAVFSPSHECAVTRHGDHQASVSFEAARVPPDRDFLLYYQRSEAGLGVVLLTHRAPGDVGTFCLRVSPQVELPADRILPKDIAFVIDTSGSMAGPKLEQAKRALRFCINSLNRADRFNIYGFSSEVHPFRNALAPASPDLKTAALAYIDELKALGGTNINAALLAALDGDPRDAQRLYLIVFITDGQPTVDVTDPEQIRANVVKRNSRQIRFHVLGVGCEVNTHLLDKLAEATRGSRDYCTEGEDLELKLSAFAGRLASPVLTDLKLHIDGVRVFDAYPQPLPDLFRGNDLVVLGRYEGAGRASIQLEGQVVGSRQVITHEGLFPQAAAIHDFLPRLWAGRKAAYLLDQIRMHGSSRELVDEVVHLAKRYGIITPYTSALILEEDVPARGRGQDRLTPILRHAAQRAAPTTPAGRGVFGPGGSVTGEAAVSASRALMKAATADTLGNEVDAFVDTNTSQRVIRHVGAKTFVNVDGRWTDSTWDEQQPPKKVAAFTDEYFALLRRRPELGPYFALGERVLVVIGEEVYESLSPEADGN